MRPTAAKKTAIAVDFVAGLSVSAICEKHNITPGGLRRLRREDQIYRETEEALLEDLLEHTRTALRNKAQQAIETLTSILELDRKNLETRTGPNNGEIRERAVDVKLLGEQRLTASALLAFWLRLEGAQREQQRWEADNLSPEDGPEDEEEEPNDE
jgi:hypothetical protein